ncbi:MAG: hypothetical protein JOZ96_28660 [Acidobacteria bacterium]|nr:hypothetical protein [Acidobacteriota bacterium]
MKTLRLTSLAALLLFVSAASQTSFAQSSAAGSYQFTLAGDKDLKTVEFSAQTNPDGSATGSIYFTDQAVITIQDVDGTGEKGRFAGYDLKVNVDGLFTAKSETGAQAVMSGTVTSSSVLEFVGQRVVFTVEDNGDNTRIPDKLTWGVYRQIKRDWVPSDAEWKEDPGVGLRWWATDYEVKGDVGYQMPRDETLHGQTFPATVYNFVDAVNTAGDIRVSP